MEWSSSPKRPVVGLLLLAVSALALSTGLLAQGSPAASLAESASVVVRGRVLRLNASDEPLLRASSRTAVILVREMYAGGQIAGDQRGKHATVILSRPNAVRAGEEAVFFGNVRFVGTTMTIADLGESAYAPGDSALRNALTRAGQVPADRVLLDRLDAADLVFGGSVIDVRPIDSRRVRSEHDPEWEIATVRVLRPLRGGDTARALSIAFPSSEDVAWFNAPKLKPGQEAVFLARKPKKEEEAFDRASGLGALIDGQSLYIVTEPYDVVPLALEARLRDLISRRKRG